MAADEEMATYLCILPGSRIVIQALSVDSPEALVILPNTSSPTFQSPLPPTACTIPAKSKQGTRGVPYAPAPRPFLTKFGNVALDPSVIERLARNSELTACSQWD